jgi:hypothetical protein
MKKRKHIDLEEVSPRLYAGNGLDTARNTPSFVTHLVTNIGCSHNHRYVSFHKWVSDDVYDTMIRFIHDSLESDPQNVVLVNFLSGKDRIKTLVGLYLAQY